MVIYILVVKGNKIMNATPQIYIKNSDKAVPFYQKAFGLTL